MSAAVAARQVSSSVLSGRANITDVLHNWSGADTLQILTAGKIPPNPSEVLGSDRMNQLVQWFAEHALVIIDAPPLLAVTDAAILAKSGRQGPEWLT